MSAEIIQFIPHRRHDDAQTGFPTIAFRSAAQEEARKLAWPSLLLKFGPRTQPPGQQYAFSSASCDARMQLPPSACQPPTPFSMPAGARPRNRSRTMVTARSN